MKKFIICLVFSLISFNLFATITKGDLESFYVKGRNSSYSISVSKSYYDSEKNILHLYKKI